MPAVPAVPVRRPRTQYSTKPTLPGAGFVMPCGFAGTPWRIASLRFGPTADAVPPLLRCRGWHGFARVCPVSAAAHRPRCRLLALARCRPPPPTCPAALARRVSGQGGALFSWASAVSRPAGTLSRAGWRCRVRFRVLAGVAGCAFACWRALFQIVLGLMCPGGPSRWGKSQNDLEQLQKILKNSSPQQKSLLLEQLQPY